jgi:hypothetical protein
MIAFLSLIVGLLVGFLVALWASSKVLTEELEQKLFVKVYEQVVAHWRYKFSIAGLANIDKIKKGERKS